MARSKRRCAASLHDVAKWTVPKRWSASSCPTAGCTNENPIATTATANVLLNMRASLSHGVAEGALLQTTRNFLARQFPERARVAWQAALRHNCAGTTIRLEGV